MLTAQQLSSMQEYLTYDDVLLLPNYSDVTPSQTDTTMRLTPRITLKVPIIASPMDTVCEAEMAIAIAKLGGYGIIHRNFTITDQVAELKKTQKAKVKAGVAVGVGSDFADRVKALAKAGAEEICIDSAHGHTKQVITAIKTIRKSYPDVEIIAGNVASYEGAKDSFRAGAMSVKIGMGPGSICTTRSMSGMGVPQLSAVIEGIRAAREMNRTIIADGGIRTSGDITKALAAGADAVMLGSLLAGTDEAPGESVQIQDKLFKAYRGMGSVAAMKKGSAARYGQEWKNGDEKSLVPEGVEGLVEHRGMLQDHLHQLVGGLRAGMGYLGAKTIPDLQHKAQFIKISRTAIVESNTHSIIQL